MLRKNFDNKGQKTQSRKITNDPAVYNQIVGGEKSKNDKKGRTKKDDFVTVYTSYKNVLGTEEKYHI